MPERQSANRLNSHPTPHRLLLFYTLCRVPTMGKKEANVRMSLQTLRVLEVFLENPAEQLAGADVHQRCGIASGTLYPILLRLESAGWFASQWESIDPSSAGRPRRRLYRLDRKSTRLNSSHANI